MKIVNQTMYVIMLFFVINIQSMARTAIEKLEKNAWQEAFQGNVSTALESFTQAANAGSWQAAQLLAYNYGKESLLDQKDETKAQRFVQLAEQYKQENPREYFSEFMLTSNIEKYKSLQFARINPWYQQVLDILNSSHSESTREYPAPERSIMRLFYKINDGKTDKKMALDCMRLFTQTMSQVPSEQATKEIFQRVNDGYSSFRFCNDAPTNYSLSKDMVKALEESALKFGLVNEVKITYKKLFSSLLSDYYGHGCDVEKPVIVQAIQELFPRYTALDPQNAVTSVTHFLERDIKHSYELDDNFLTLLRILSNQQLDKYITDLSEKHRVNVVKAFCVNKDSAPTFQGTVLDIDLIAQKVLHAELNEENTSILIALLKSGNKDFYQKYQNDIVAVLPAFMEKAGHEYKTVIKLVTDSDIPFLQKKILRLLVEYTANMQEDSYWKKFVVERLLEDDTFSSDQRSELYQLMDEIYQTQQCVHGLQFLWMHLKDNEDQRSLLRASLEQHFGFRLSLDPAASFENLLNEALTESYSKPGGRLTSREFLATIDIAHQTKLAAYIEPEFLAAQKDMVIFDPSCSFEHYAVFLDQRLCAMLTGKERGNFAQRLNQYLVGDDKRIYARDIFIALSTASSSFEICKAKKSLQEMHKKYELKRSIPEIVWRVSRDLENFAYCKHRPAERRPIDRTPLDSELRSAQLGRDGLLYASAANNPDDCSLWAIDAKTLDAVWQVKVKNYEHVQGKQPKFVLYDDLLYLVDGMEIFAFYRKTGTGLGYCSYELEGSPVVRLLVDASGLLYVVQGDDPCNKNTVVTIDPDTDESALFESNIARGGKEYFTAGQTFGYYYMPDRTITLYAKDGSVKVIPLCADKKESWFFDPCLTIKDNNIIFVQCRAKDNYQLVCYDTSTNIQTWCFPLAGKIETEPCISSDGQRIFIVKKKNIIALHVNGGDVRELWNFDIPQGRSYSLDVINELEISPDGKVLFALNVHMGDLYTINAHDGTLIAKSVCDEGRSRYLVGVSDDNLPYIQPVYY